MTWYHLDSHETVPQLSVTGEPGEAYLSAPQLQGHVRQIHACLFSATEALCAAGGLPTLLFLAFGNIRIIIAANR